MSEDLDRKFANWIAAEAADREDEADAACSAVFSAAVPDRLVPLTFAPAVMARVAEARAAQVRRAQRARKVFVAAAVILGPIGLYFGSGPLVSAAAWLFVASLNLLVQFGLQVVTVSDWSIWSLFGNIGRASAAVLSDSTFTIAMLAMHGIAVAALVALQRLLGPEA